MASRIHVRVLRMRGYPARAMPRLRRFAPFTEKAAAIRALHPIPEPWIPATPLKFTPWPTDRECMERSAKAFGL